jgi:hypothetical protein
MHKQEPEKRQEMVPPIDTTPQHSPQLVTITGPLPGERRFAGPFDVLIDYDDGEVVVSEPRFHIHASASTITEALTEFRRVFSGYLDVLSSEEKDLDGYMQEQLRYLHANIISGV